MSIDDYSKKLWVYPIKRKSNVLLVFKEFKARVNLENSERIICLGYDDNVKGYHLWSSTPQKVIVCRDVMMLHPEDIKEQENLVCMLNKSMKD